MSMNSRRLALAWSTATILKLRISSAARCRLASDMALASVAFAMKSSRYSRVKRPERSRSSSALNSSSTWVAAVTLMPSGVSISCDTPATSEPRAASFSDCTSLSCMRCMFSTDWVSSSVRCRTRCSRARFIRIISYWLAATRCAMRSKARLTAATSSRPRRPVRTDRLPSAICWAASRSLSMRRVSSQPMARPMSVMRIMQVAAIAMPRLIASSRASSNWVLGNSSARVPVRAAGLPRIRLRQWAWALGLRVSSLLPISAPLLATTTTPCASASAARSTCLSRCRPTNWDCSSAGLPLAIACNEASLSMSSVRSSCSTTCSCRVV